MLTNSKFVCAACNERGTKEVLLAREKMFGFGDFFAYIKCSKCGCLQLENMDINFSKYYPECYYSFVAKNSKPKWIKWLEKSRNLYVIKHKGIIGLLISIFKPHAPLQALHGLEISSSTKILDVGCGDGELLRSLTEVGFESLHGVDPNIASAYISDRYSIYKCEIKDLIGKYDLVMFHHSLEHIPDQIGTLESVKRLLSPDGVCLIRIPIIGKFAWRQYGLNWVQLDAPRHLFLHTELSIKILANRAGFKVVSMFYDSNEFQFWGSECLSNDVPLFDAVTGLPTAEANQIRKKSPYTWKRNARRLNADNDGDQVCILLKLADNGTKEI